MVSIYLSVEENHKNYKIEGIDKAINTLRNKECCEPIDFICAGSYNDINTGLQQEIGRLERRKDVCRGLGIATVFFLIPPALAEFYCIKLDKKIEDVGELLERLYYQYA